MNDSLGSEFLRFAIETSVLRFGEFTLKSGRNSPYFFNTGLFNTGARLSRLAAFYADAIAASGVDFDMLYGPAYKGIPLVAAVSMALHQRHGRDLPYCFNRKEIKDHGEGGNLVGASPSGRVLVVDDVVSAGTSTRESMAILSAHGAQVVALVICLDRQERGPEGTDSAIQEIERDLGLTVISIATLNTLVDLLGSIPGHEQALTRVKAYRAQFGAE